MTALTPEKLFESASQYEKLGYRCLPVRLEIDAAGKKRVIPPKQWQMRSFREAADWTANGFVPNGIATNCGTSGIVVVDVDTGPGKDGGQALLDAGLKLRPGAVVSTQSGGFHGFFKRGDVRLGHDSHSKIADGVDIKAFGMLILPPSVVEGGGEYTWRGGTEAIPAVADLPVFPDEIAKTLLADSPKQGAVATLDAVDPAELTDTQRAAGVVLLNKKISALEDLKDGERFEGLGKVIRIAGIAKSLGEDPVVIAKRVVDAYENSGGTSTDQVTSAIESAWKNASPDDPAVWRVEDLSEDAFWECRPELSKIRKDAERFGATRWAALGAVLVNALSDVPYNHRIDTGWGGRATGNLNLFVLLAATVGGGKGTAQYVADELWQTDAERVKSGSGEALKFRYAHTEPGGAGTYATVFHNRSVIIDASEYRTLDRAAGRQGSTLTDTLTAGFSCEALTSVTVDQAKNVAVPKNSYRLGMITGLQFDNAGLLFGGDAEATGLTARMLWMAADRDHTHEFEDQKAPVTSLKKHRFTTGDRVLDTTIGIRRDVWIQNMKPGTQHDAYTQVKVAYGLAVLNGHHLGIRDQDWELSKHVLKHSRATRAAARKHWGERSRSKALTTAKLQGEAEAESDEAKHDAEVTKCSLRVLAILGGTRGNGWIGRSIVRKSISKHQRRVFDATLATLNVRGLIKVDDRPGEVRICLAKP